MADPRAIDGTALLASAVGFGRALQEAGIGGDLAASIDFGRALTLVEIGDREQVRAAGAAVFVRRRDELPTYHAVFARYWRRPGAAPAQGDRPAWGEHRPQLAGEAGTARDGQGGDEEGGVVRRVGWSPAEALRHRSFAAMTPDELRDAERMIDLLAPRLATRRTRRHELHAHGRTLALRAMLRRNLGTGAQPLAWIWRRPVRRPRPMVVLADVSGSMDRHARLLLRFVHALSRTPVRLEAFVFGTRLTRVTRHLRERDPDRALADVGAEARFGSGGTRIGEAFHTFNRRWTRRVLPTSGVVLVLSDGWDHGRPELIAEETRRLARGCHALVWLNPLAGAASYRPVASGMAAAHPAIDHFLPADSVADLEALGRLLGGVLDPSAGRRVA